MFSSALVPFIHRQADIYTTINTLEEDFILSLVNAREVNFLPNTLHTIIITTSLGMKMIPSSFPHRRHIDTLAQCASSHAMMQ